MAHDIGERCIKNISSRRKRGSSIFISTKMRSSDLAVYNSDIYRPLRESTQAQQAVMRFSKFAYITEECAIKYKKWWKNENT